MNGSSKIIWWLLGLFATCLIGGVTYAFSDLHEMHNVNSTQTERIIKIETHYEAIVKQLDTIERKLDKMNEKLEQHDKHR